MKRKITLMEAKNILKTEKVFLNGNNFNYVNVGKYASGCTLVIPQEWSLDCDGKPESPIRYSETPEITDNMNIEFDGRATVLFGMYHVSQAGKPVFKITSPDKAQDILVRVNWGGAFSKTSGYRMWSVPKIGEKYYLRASSNGRGVGNDYWVFAIGFVYKSDSKDVSDILFRLSEEETERIKYNEKLFLEKETARIASIEAKEKILPECKALVDRINALKQKYGLKFEVEFKEEYMVDCYSKIPYTKACNYLQEKLKEVRTKVSHRKEYTEIIEQISNDVLSLGGSIYYTDIDQISIKFDHEYYRKAFVCDSVFNVKKLVDYVEEERIRQEKEKALIIENMIKAKKEQELKETKIAAKKAGCPEIFSYWNRVGGATGQSHAYVIRPDGSIRTPDDNILNNYNHRHQKNWLENADGTQVYDQILIGELIVAYTKDCTKAPVKIFIEWVPESITESQKETVNNIYNDLQRLYDNPQFVNKYGDTILSGNEWLEGESS